MEIQTEILLNQFAQGIKTRDQGIAWFAALDDDVQKAVVSNLVYMIIQAGVIGSDASYAVKESNLKSSFTPCQLLLKSENEDSASSVAIRKALGKIDLLPKNERSKTFIVLICLLGISDSRRRSSEKECNHWWHSDLSDENIVSEIIKQNKF